MIRVIEAFSGIGAQHMALEELHRENGLEYEIVATVEIDDTAVKGYEAIHGPVHNLGDITKVEHLPECDLLFYSYPCTSISQAGKQEGMVEGSGTASSLLWEVKRLLLDMKERGCLPEYLGMENVPMLLAEKNRPQFNAWIQFLNDLGYTSSYTVMNAKDYGVPQNRARVFMVSCLHSREFIFPGPCPDGRVLKDVLEEDVPEEYFLSSEKIAKFEEHRIRQEENGRGFGWVPKDPSKDCWMNAITTNPERNATGNYVKIGLKKVGTLDPNAYEVSNRVYAIDGVSPTLTCRAPGIIKVTRSEEEVLSEEVNDSPGNPSLISVGTEPLDNGAFRIRYLTPRECLRLQAFPDDAIDRLMSAVPSKAQLHKLAGNSIAVCCLKAIFKGMFVDGTFRMRNDRQVSLERFL